MKNGVNDFDLDIYNLIKKVPKDEGYVYFYLRGKEIDQGNNAITADTVAAFSGSDLLMAASLHGIMNSKKEIVAGILGGVAEFLSDNQNKEFKNAFMQVLDNNVKRKS